MHSYTIQVIYFYSRWVVYYTCKTLFILYLQTHIASNFLFFQNHEEIEYFHLQFSITHARYARLISLNLHRLHVNNVRNFWCYFFLDVWCLTDFRASYWLSLLLIQNLFLFCKMLVFCSVLLYFSASLHLSMMFCSFSDRVIFKSTDIEKIIYRNRYSTGFQVTGIQQGLYKLFLSNCMWIC